MHHNEKLLYILLAFGADPNTKDAIRMSKLHFAAAVGRTNQFRLMLRSGN